MDLIVMAARVEAFTANSGQALGLAQQGAGHPIRAHATGDLLHTAQVILQRSVLSTTKSNHFVSRGRSYQHIGHPSLS